MCPSQLNGNWATITVKFCPYFKKCAVATGTNMVNPNHETVSDNEESRKVWLKFVQEEVLGKNYRNTMTMGWNRGLTKLMESSTTKTGINNNMGVVDFSF